MTKCNFFLSSVIRKLDGILRRQLVPVYHLRSLLRNERPRGVKLRHPHDSKQSNMLYDALKIDGTGKVWGHREEDAFDHCINCVHRLEKHDGSKGPYKRRYPSERLSELYDDMCSPF